MSIRLKLIFTIIVISITASVPLSLYLSFKQEEDKLSQTVKIGNSNAQILARTMADSFIKSEADLESAKIDAEEMAVSFKDQFGLGLIAMQTVLLPKKYKGKVLSVLINTDYLSNTRKLTDRQLEKLQNDLHDTLPARQLSILKDVQSYRNTKVNGIPDDLMEFVGIGKYQNIQLTMARLFISRSYILEPIRKMRILILIISLSAILMAFLIGLVLSRIFTKPIYGLIDGARKYGSGELDYRVAVKSRDEFRTLAETFNGMAQDIRVKIKEIEDYRDNLELKVQERTAELNTALEQVSELKVQQDGDYFLTYLLLQPFTRTKAENEFTEIEVLIDQKKKFSFKHWSAEIGGDICLSETITLKGKSYTFFMNGDAMGKSMQGAGGALVLGSGMLAILQRTQSSHLSSDQFPERWLKNAFLELHKVFESFDGHMLVSVTMGLIDNKTGLMYHLNAEHPPLVLFRDNKATFISNGQIFRKLGTPGISGKIAIDLFEIHPGDVIYAGSDGRDDLELEGSTTESRQINEDETLFLRNLEKSGGDLEKLVTEIKNTGELIDDISLMKMIFRGHRVQSENEPSDSIIREIRDLEKQNHTERALAEIRKQLEKHADNRILLRDYIRLLIRVKDYTRALESGRNYLFLFPEDNEMLFVVSQCAKVCGKVNEGIDIGERLKLRMPYHVKNLANLAELYLKTGNFERAAEITSMGLTQSPHDQNLIKIKEKLKP